MTEELMRDFAVGGSALGSLSAMYFYAYVVLQIPVGILMDRFGPRKLMSAALVLCAIASICMASSNSLLMASASRLVIGGSVAFAFVGTLTILTCWFAPARFAMLAGLLQSSGMVGAMLGQAPLRIAVEHYHWRVAIYGLGALALVLAIAAFFVVPRRDRSEPSAVAAGSARGSITNKNSANDDSSGRPDSESYDSESCDSESYDSKSLDPDNRDSANRDLKNDGLRDSETMASDSGDEVSDGVSSILARRRNWLCAFAGFGMAAPMLGFAALWAVPWLTTVRGISPTQSAGIASMVFLGWLLVAPVAGWISDRIGRRKPVLVAGSLLSLGAFVAILYIPTDSIFIMSTLFFLQGVGGCSMVICFSIMREYNAHSHTSAALGMLNTCVVGSGAVMQPLIGLALDSRWQGSVVQGVRVYVGSNYNGAFLLLIAAGVLAVICSLLLPETWCRVANKKLVA